MVCILQLWQYLQDTCFVNIPTKNCHCCSLQNSSGFRSRSGIIVPEEWTFNGIVPSDLINYHWLPWVYSIIHCRRYNKMNNTVSCLFDEMLFILKTHVAYRFHAAACVWYGSHHNTNTDPHITLRMICLTSVFHDLCGVNVVLLCESVKWPVIAVFFFRPSNLFSRNRRPAQPMTFKYFQWSFKLGQFKSVQKSFWYHRKLGHCCCVWGF
jgi:hypothetical protein